MTTTTRAAVGDTCIHQDTPGGPLHGVPATVSVNDGIVRRTYCDDHIPTTWMDDQAAGFHRGVEDADEFLTSVAYDTTAVGAEWDRRRLQVTNPDQAYLLSYVGRLAYALDEECDQTEVAAWHEARSLARATGATQVTVRHERREADGTLTTDAEATHDRLAVIVPEDEEAETCAAQYGGDWCVLPVGHEGALHRLASGWTWSY